jgi:hypothetical protein
MRLLHRFYDLHTGGGEVVVATIVQAFPEHEHVLVFTRHQESWLSAQLRAARNVRLIKTEAKLVRKLVDQVQPDRLLFHYYPPMKAQDFEGLSADQLSRTFLYSHWYHEVPVVPGLAGYIFPSPFGRSVVEMEIPAGQASVVLNPVREQFFDVSRCAGGPFTVGRHSRDDAIKFSPDFIMLFEQMEIPDLQVRVLGFHPAVETALAKRSFAFKHTYWVMPKNTIPVWRFLRFLDLFVYKTADDFSETCPLVILEAMAAGIPVVAERKGGICDLVQHGETGFLCAESADYKQAVERLYGDAALRQQFSDASREWVREHASLAAFRRGLENVLG